MSVPTAPFASSLSPASPASPPPSPRLVGVIHLPALPGSPRHGATMAQIVDQVVQDARILEGAGFDLVMVENFGDAPFFRHRVPSITVASMAVCAQAIRAACPNLRLGINVLRNDGFSALAIAVAVGAVCIRVNVLSGARVTDQGIIEGEAAELLREKRALDAQSVALWADVDVKHSAPLGPPRDLAAETKDVALRGLADALLVTGEGTGAPVDVERLRIVRKAAGSRPVLVASGAHHGSLAALSTECAGVIVGSDLREGGVAGGPIVAARAESFAKEFRRTFGTT